MTRALGARQAAVLTLLWVSRPLSVRGYTLGDVASPMSSNTHQRRCLSRLILRDLITSNSEITEDASLLSYRYQLTAAGVTELRHWAKHHDPLTGALII